ncbi:hypothetical protein COCMIDRAFT_27349 [Bipolaris oryzae ATCC 44560]|uniref:Uncharacterized protein n=1 Tax=Bipolaris oryzae ATCC 44560 TaxID=930090 RepID=W6ZL13_COCMI|nr:uncharacterized protein COCMIDRAFT_27349 [Bipolaris oryzae ATCC 44560]EUC44286.1 hypothetical protein COCMIDRAFT_27349 [Bipolaris oryzae ATCC 44560]
MPKPIRAVEKRRFTQITLKALPMDLGLAQNRTNWKQKSTKPSKANLFFFLPSAQQHIVPVPRTNAKTACLSHEQEAVPNLNEQTKTCNTREDTLMNELTEQKNEACKAREDLLTAQPNKANAELPLKQQQQQQPKYGAMLAEENLRRAHQFQYLGCYVESRERAINGKVTTDSAITRQKCMAFCEKDLYHALGGGER